MASKSELESYLQKDSKVKAARKKLDATGSALEKAKSTLAKAPASTPEDVLADIRAEISRARSEYSDAKSLAQAEESRVTEFFNANYDKIIAKEAGGSIAKLQEQLKKVPNAQAAAAIQASIQDLTDKKNRTGKYAPKATPSGAEGGVQNQVAPKTVEEANAQIDALSENARQFLFEGMDSAERINLAKTLTAAGYITPELNGEFNDNLVANYKMALSNAKSWNNSNKELKTFEPVDFSGFLTYRTRLNGGTGMGAGGGATDVYTPQVSITNPSEASGLINSQMKQAFGRDATAAEISTITKVLNKIESVNPLKRSGTKGGQYQYSGSIEPSEVIRQLIQDPTLVSLKGIDTKTATSLIKSVNKLGLADEFAKRKTDKTQLALDTIKETARANGLPLTEAQLAKFSNRIANGEGVDVMQKEIRNIVAGTMPDSVKKLLDGGSDLEDVYAPYRQSMASILEIPVDKIDLNDPTLGGAITAQGNMPLYEFKRSLRKDPRWQYTDNARDTVSTGLTQVLKDFGFMG
jgi:hypothetical protein